MVGVERVVIGDVNDDCFVVLCIGDVDVGW